VSIPTRSPSAPLRFPLLTRAPRPSSRWRLEPPEPLPSLCSPLDRGRRRPLRFCSKAPIFSCNL
jgi:hypothetical protein